MMKMKFSNAEVEVWKLRKGVVLGCGSEYVHLVSFSAYEEKSTISVIYSDGGAMRYNSTLLEWLEPHD
jgi:hypothetical protein